MLGGPPAAPCSSVDPRLPASLPPSLEYSSCPLMAWLSILAMLPKGTFCARGRQTGRRRRLSTFAQQADCEPHQAWQGLPVWPAAADTAPCQRLLKRAGRQRAGRQVGRQADGQAHLRGHRAAHPQLLQLGLEGQPHLQAGRQEGRQEQARQF